MGMDMIPICMSCHYDFKAGNLLRQLQCNLVSLLRGDRIVGMEGLHHMIVHSSAGAVVLLLGIQKLPQGNHRDAVDTGHQRSAIVIYLGCLAAVIEDTTQATHRLGAPVLYEVNDGHFRHRLALRRSDSKELTCAYASVSSLRYTVFTLPMLERVVS